MSTGLPKRRWDDGPLGLALRVAWIVTSLLAVIALVLAIKGLNSTTANRRDSARDSCRLLLGLVHSATTGAPRQRAAAQLFITRTPLRNCDTYAQELVK